MKDAASSKRSQGNISPEHWGEPVFENSAIGMAVAELNGRFLMANSAFQRMTGYTEAELRTLTLPDLTEEADRLSQPAAGETRQYRVEKRYRRKDGSPIWVRVTVSPIRERPGLPAQALVIAEDVTECRRALDELKKQNALLQRAFDNIPLLLDFTGEDGLNHLVSREFERTLGWTFEEIQGRGVDILAECYANAHDRREVPDSINAAQGQWADFRPRVRDGRTLDTAWAQVRLSEDITGRWRAEERLRRSEAYLTESERLAHIASWAVAVPTREIVYWSREHYRIFGFDPGMGLPPLDAVLARIHPEDSAARETINRAIGEKADFELDYRILLPDGSIRYVRSRGRPVVNGAGELVEFIGTAMDVTERKLAEDALQRYIEQLRALAARVESVREEERTRLARQIHDELGQALTGIKMGVKFLGQQPPPRREERARRSQAIGKLIDDAIRFVRGVATDLRPGILDDLGLVAAVEWAAEEFEKRSGTKCTLELPREDLVVEPEVSTAFFRILQEALTNIARHAEATEFSVRLTESDGGLRLEVRDNGKSLDEARLAHAGSLGILGMRERALLLGGRLTIGGSPGEGATVTAWIPTH